MTTPISFEFPVSDPLETHSTGSLEEDRFDNVAVFEYMNLTPTGHVTCAGLAGSFPA
jgi:hypothetical protein